MQNGSVEKRNILGKVSIMAGKGKTPDEILEAVLSDTNYTLDGTREAAKTIINEYQKYLQQTQSPDR